MQHSVPREVHSILVRAIASQWVVECSCALVSSVQSCVLVRAFAVQCGVKCITVLVSRVCFCSSQCNANVHCGDHIEGVQRSDRTDPSGSRGKDTAAGGAHSISIFALLKNI